MAPRNTNGHSRQTLEQRRRQGTKRYSLGLAQERGDSRNDNRKAALKRLGIESPLPSLPAVTSLLKEADQGLPQVLDALRSSQEEEAKLFLEKYDELSQHDRARLQWEEIAFAIGVDPFRLLEVAVSSLMRHCETLGNIIAATAHPRVVRKAVEVATHCSDAWRDRQNLLNARGFLPVQKSAVIYNRVQVASLTSSNPENEEASELPEMEDDLRDIHGLLLADADPDR